MNVIRIFVSPMVFYCFLMGIIFRFWGNVCRSLLFFGAIGSGKEAKEHTLEFRFLHTFDMTWLFSHLTCCFLQLTFVFLVLPCLLLGYLGQAAYLMENQTGAEQAFFSSIPSKCILSLCWYWIHWSRLYWSFLQSVTNYSLFLEVITWY